ncbi:hypothetical protein [uncultured Sphingomonas sp.]|uniref:hypothetical protein n=1 Tax=uncultured Sphingomonas sp. TaxID=158754 RepID=UPI0035CA98FD
MFTIEPDERAALLRLKLTGFWTPETVRAFVAALLPAVEQMQRRCPTYSILSDSTEFPVQSPEVGEGFARIMVAGASRTRGRTAIVVSTMLNQFQARRVFDSPNIRVFRERKEALAWLAETRADAA